MLQFSKEMLTREPSIPAPEGISGCQDAFAWTASRRRNTDADRPNLWSPAPMSYTTAGQLGRIINGNSTRMQALCKDFGAPFGHSPMSISMLASMPDGG